MQVPLRISFHQLEPSEALEADVRYWVDELESFFEGIISCRVSIEMPHRSQHQGGLYRIHVELGVPGSQIVVGRSPADHAAHADPYVAVRDAFRAVRRQLGEYVRRLRGDVKDHVAPPRGRVVHVEPDLEYGRLAASDGREVYFHRNSVIGGIERLGVGAEVRFHEEPGDKGPQASSVEAIGEHGRHQPSRGEP